MPASEIQRLLNNILKLTVVKRLITICAVAAALSASAGASTENAVAPLPTSTGKTAMTPRPLAFSWGADLGGGIDVSGHNMSTLGFSAQFGMQWKWIRFFGIGAEADIMVGNSSRTFPLSAIFRTDFCNYSRLVFMELRGGVALNYLDGDPQETVPYGSAGIGVTLATGKSFSSHIIVGYTYNGRKECYLGDTRRNCPGMSLVSMRIGLSF